MVRAGVVKYTIPTSGMVIADWRTRENPSIVWQKGVSAAEVTILGPFVTIREAVRWVAKYC